MPSPPKPTNETVRLKSLQTLNILNTPISEGFERITRLTKALFNTPIVAISLIDDERQWFKSIQGLNVCETPREVSFCAHTILQDGIFIINDTHQDPRFASNPLVTGEPHIRFYAGYPIKSSHGHKIGSLCIIDRKPREYTFKDLAPLKDMAALVQDELMNQRNAYAQSQLINELDETKRNSMIDPLTRLWNRAAIENILLKQVTLCRAQERGFGFAIIDIDNFKRVNDTYGHLAGDYVLTTVSKFLLSNLRDVDSVGRWGGEEFFIIIDTDDEQKVIDLMERARIKINSTTIEYENETIHVTFTAGLLFVSPSDLKSIPDLIGLADQRLYRGKETGKNKIIHSE